MNHKVGFALVFLLNAVIPSAQKTVIKSPSSFFPAGKAQVLVVGSFHFDYPGLDVNKTAEGDKVDVLKEPKKSEVTELVNYIKKFRPTKIAIEATAKWNAVGKLTKYKQGEFRNERDERFQLGMRIAADMKLDTIYSIDAPSFADDLTTLDSAYVEKLFKDFDFKSDDKYNTLMTDWFNYEDKLPKQLKLLDYFKRLNSREYHRLDYGAYLVGDFKLDDTRGADILSVWWYNRNLRIFRKIQQLTTSAPDRILVIFGNGHAAILRQLLESSPEYKWIEFDSLK